jgi:hypothetical protein
MREQAPPGERPDIVGEAAQVMECTWDRDIDIDGQLGSSGDSAAAHFVLRIDRLLMRPNYIEGIEDGSVFPHFPIFYGFRANGEFWFAEHGPPAAVAVPKVAGQELQSVVYLANRIDSKIRFTDDACEKLTGIPRPFLKDALHAIVDAARIGGIEMIDSAALEQINAQRQH